MWGFLLLAETNDTVDWVALGLRYGVLVAIIIVSLILLAVLRKGMKKEASLTKVKGKCERAKSYAEKLLGKTSKKELLIASTKLTKLSSLIAEAEWNALRIVEEKKDIVLEGIAAQLDALSTTVSAYAAEAFFNKEEYVETLSSVVNELAAILQTVEKTIAEKE